MARFGKMTTILAVAGLSVGAAPPPAVLAPTSPWAIDYAANSCRLVRTFGTGKWAGKLVFEQVEPHGAMNIMLFGNFTENGSNVLEFAPLPKVMLTSERSFTTADGAQRVAYWRGALGRGKWGLIPPDAVEALRRTDGRRPDAAAPSFSGTPIFKWKDKSWTVPTKDEIKAGEAGFDARADQVQSLILNPGTSRAVSLQTGQLWRPFKALDKCARDSLKDWGIDPAVEDTIVIGAHPASDPAGKYTADDYPMAALAAGHEDHVDVWLNIDAAGRITNCRPISAFDSPEINNRICDVVKRKETFVPARTREGIAVPDYYIESFVFRLGG